MPTFPRERIGLDEWMDSDPHLSTVCFSLYGPSGNLSCKLQFNSTSHPNHFLPKQDLTNSKPHIPILIIIIFLGDLV